MPSVETGANASVLSYKGTHPKLDDSVFLCEGVRIIGDVEIGPDSSVWYNSVIRGDVHWIKIGKATNIQDLSMLHVTNGKFPLSIGDHTSVGHSVALHGCTIGNSCLIGIGARVLDGAVVGNNCLVAAGTVVREGFEVPDGVLIAGVPGKIIRPLTDAEKEKIHQMSYNYIHYVEDYRSQI